MFYSKNIIKIVFFIFLLLLSGLSLGAEESVEISTEKGKKSQDEDLFRKVVIYGFDSQNKDNKEKYYSEIIPGNIGKELERTERYFVEIKSDILKISDLKDKEYSAYLNNLSEKANSNSADYLVTGTYRTVKKNIYISCHVYIARLNKILIVNSSRKDLGVFLSGLIDEVTQKIDTQMAKFNLQKTGVPTILPRGGIYSFYETINMKSGFKNAEIWYTLDGNDPDKTNATLYTGPFDLYKSATVKAVTYKKGFRKSDMAKQHYKIKDPVKLLAFGAMYGRLSFIKDYNNSFVEKSTEIITGYAYVQLGKLGLRKVPVLRNMAVFGAVDFAYAEIDGAGPTGLPVTELPPFHMNFMGLYGGLMYKIRLGSYFSIDLNAGAGQARVTISSDKEHLGFKSHFAQPVHPAGFEWIVPYFSGGMQVEAAVGPVLCTISTSYKYLMFKDSDMWGADKIDPMEALAFQAGVGLRF
jgi:TolB-like protein